MTELLHALGVFAALSMTLVVPPLLMARRLTPEGCGWMTVLNALALGCASQGILGLFWDRLVACNPQGEMALYYGFWLIASLIAAGLSRVRGQDSPIGRKESWLLALVLLSAAVVRSLHPLRHSALGQSDAYSHLQFIRQVVADGLIHNPMYPPAFSWIMALPAATFCLDPYWLARFGGAFFGAGLTLALYAIGRCSGRQRAALCSAALVAFCPVLMPLLKTGVGVFANQMGLFLLPLVLLLYLRLDQPRSFWLLLALTMALAAAVPMMLISWLPVLLADRLLAGAAREPRWWRSSGLAVAALIPAVVLLFWQSTRMQGIHRAATMLIVTEGQVKPGVSSSEPKASAPGEAQRPSRNVLLLQNYLSLKRRGYGSPALNLSGLGLGLAFLTVLTLGLRKREASWRLLGTWGLVTSVQAAAGVMQFSGYQREGWSLLLATAWLGGTIGAGILTLDGRRFILHDLAVGTFSAFLVWTCLHPPGHPLSFSAAEDEIIDVTRRVAQRVRHDTTEWPLTIVTRRFTGFCGNQGDLLDAAIGQSARVKTTAIGQDTRWRGVVHPDRQYLFVMDRRPPAAGWSPGLFAQLQPEQVEHFVDVRLYLFKANARVEEWLGKFSEDQWKRERLPTSSSLEAILVRPNS